MVSSRWPWLHSPLERRAAFCWLVAVAVGCSGIGVRRVDAPDPLAEWRASAVAAGHLSARSLQTLRSLDLESLYLHRPEEAAARLHAEAVADPRADSLFALAEVNYLLGREAEKREYPDAVGYYLRCAGYAYHYLFPPASSTGQPSVANVLDPQFRLACDLYNVGLSKCLRVAQRSGHLKACEGMTLPGTTAGLTAPVEHVGFPWKAAEFGPLLFCEDYDVVGLNNRVRTYGLGVPLIGTRSPDVPLPANAYYGANASFPVTAFLHFEGTLADLGSGRVGRLGLYNTRAIQSVAERGRTVTLESDLTTPLAHFLAGADLQSAGLAGFLKADKVAPTAGIRMLEPYQPGKIPVILVHGLLSSPLTWAPLFNDLQGDADLRSRYQFWAFFYPTGDPFLASAADLRRAIEKVRSDVDPEHRDGALEQMVLVGHSMGGLLSRLTTVNGGDDFWSLAANKPFDGIKVHPETREELKQTYYFERESVVKRVVFLGTPHHGSNLSPSPIGRLGDRLVSFRQRLRLEEADLMAGNPELRGHLLPSSIDLLAPNSPALEALATRPRPADVHYHSVIGVEPGDIGVLEKLFTNDHGPSDGVVPYASAHLEGVDSEVVVRADHFHVHQHPGAVREVRRILLEHLRSLSGPGMPAKDADSSGIQRVAR